MKIFSIIVLLISFGFSVSPLSDRYHTYEEIQAQLSNWNDEFGNNINPSYPEDSPEKMAEKVGEWGITFPYLVDQTQSVAKQYDAQCTPDIYLVDGKMNLFYHGRLDE